MLNTNMANRQTVRADHTATGATGPAPNDESALSRPRPDTGRKTDARPTPTATIPRRVLLAELAMRPVSSPIDIPYWDQRRDVADHFRQYPVTAEEIAEEHAERHAADTSSGSDSTDTAGSEETASPMSIDASTEIFTMDEFTASENPPSSRRRR